MVVLFVFHVVAFPQYQY